MTQKATDSDLWRAKILSELSAVAVENGGQLPPHAIVDRARNPSSALHAEFEWNDGEAAEMYRQAQARGLVRRVRFTVISHEEVGGKTRIQIHSARGYQSRPSQRNQGGGYERVTDIMADPQKRDELINQVLRELMAYRRRYAGLIALSAIWNSIDEVFEELQDAPARQGTAGQADSARL